MIRSPGNSKFVKKINRLTVLNIIRDNELISRQELAALTGLTLPAITGIVRQLIDLGFVREVGLGNSQGGRRPMKLKFNADMGYIIGVEITCSETTIAIANLKNRPSAFRTVPMDMTDPVKGTEKLADTIKDIAASDKYADKKFWGVGVACPGLINTKTGVVRRSVNLSKDWTDYPLKDRLEKLLAIPVTIENNSNSAVLGESWFGKGQNYASLVYINLGEGISAGILANGQVLQGYRGYAGEIGHLVIRPNGSLCNCGNRGCLETVCGIPAILQRANSEIRLQPDTDSAKQAWLQMGERITVDELLVHAARPGSYAWQLFRDIGSSVGLAVANVINLYNPEAIIVGGKLAGAGEVLMQAIQAEARANAFPEIAQDTGIYWSDLGDRAAVIGACALVLRQLWDSPETLLLAEC